MGVCMARIRSIKPEFFTNEKLSALPEVTHYGMAAGLLTYADDEGYFNANPGLIRAALFPLRDPSVSIHDMLTQLSGIDFIQIIECSDGRKYGHIKEFSTHQYINRPTESKIKKLIKSRRLINETHGGLTEDSLLEGKGKEQGNGKEGKGAHSRDDSPAPEEEILPGVDNAAWCAWLEYRKKIRKPLKQVSMLAAQRELSAFGSEQMAVVQQSIAYGYQGLFPLKNKQINFKNGGRKTLADYQPDLRENDEHHAITANSKRVV